MALEGFRERGWGPVASASRDSAQRVVACAQPGGGRVDAEACEVALWGLANQFLESRCECRAGHRQAMRQRLHGPRPVRVAMEDRQSLTDLPIPDRCQPARVRRLRVVLELGANCLNEQDVSKTSNNLVCSGLPAVQLRKDVLSRQSEPWPGALLVTLYVE